MARPKVWPGSEMSKPIFVRLPMEAFEILEDEAYEQDKPVASVIRKIVCDHYGVIKPPLPRKKKAKK